MLYTYIYIEIDFEAEISDKVLGAMDMDEFVSKKRNTNKISQSQSQPTDLSESDGM